ncbi:uncharacterized protein LOC126428016 [Schistocerca serialis cubense]|uniref:uncharacterized protein LOC126428016 n=1 Tax=Schistocerca serialis cubense TaxID=2023355 RepID=UPI00214F0361|nr:uncharacterized protein LOC126428016 [Schistocerca serialis cubense]
MSPLLPPWPRSSQQTFTLATAQPCHPCCHPGPGPRSKHSHWPPLSHVTPAATLAQVLAANIHTGHRSAMSPLLPPWPRSSQQTFTLATAQPCHPCCHPGPGPRSEHSHWPPLSHVTPAATLAQVLAANIHTGHRSAMSPLLPPWPRSSQRTFTLATAQPCHPCCHPGPGPRSEHSHWPPLSHVTPAATLAQVLAANIHTGHRSAMSHLPPPWPRSSQRTFTLATAQPCHPCRHPGPGPRSEHSHWPPLSHVTPAATLAQVLAANIHTGHRSAMSPLLPPWPRSWQQTFTLATAQPCPPVCHPGPGPGSKHSHWPPLSPVTPAATLAQVLAVNIHTGHRSALSPRLPPWPRSWQ